MITFRFKYHNNDVLPIDEVSAIIVLYMKINFFPQPLSIVAQLSRQKSKIFIMN